MNFSLFKFRFCRSTFINLTRNCTARVEYLYLNRSPRSEPGDSGILKTENNLLEYESNENLSLTKKHVSPNAFNIVKVLI